MFLLHTILIQHLFNKKKVRKFSYPPQSKCSTLSKCYSNQLEKSTRLLQDCFRGSTESLEMFVGRDRWSSSTPTPHSKQGKLQSWFRVHRASLSHIWKLKRMEVLWAISPRALTSQNKCTGISHVRTVQPLALLDSLHIPESSSSILSCFDSGIEQEEDFSALD